MRHLFIINPAAGKRETTPQLEALLEKARDGIAGKTGTSQNFGVWFAGFFPADEPRWSIAVYIADGQSGGSDAGGVCREIAEKIAILEDITNTSKV